MFKVASNFFGSFKIGDNINYNLVILRQLYKCLNDLKKEEKNLLYKPITIIIVSIIEALLYDFIEIRIKTHTREGVGKLHTKTLEAIRKSKFDNMSKYIDCVEKYKLLRFKKIYTNLDDLRKLRNRVHIQNTKKDFEVNEDEVWYELK